MWSCLSFCRRLFFSSMSDCKARSEAGRICRLSRLSSMFLAFPWRSSCEHNRSGTVSETRLSDKQSDLVAFSSLTYGFQVHSPDFVIYDDNHHCELSIHPRVWLRTIIDQDWIFRIPGAFQNPSCVFVGRHQDEIWIRQLFSRLTENNCIL